MSKTTITNDQLRDIIDESPASPEDNAGKLVICDEDGKLPATIALSNKSQIDGLDGSGLINLQLADIYDILPTDIIQPNCKDDTVRTSLSTTPVKVTELVWNEKSATVNIYFELCMVGGFSYNAQAIIYVNGSAVGTPRQTGSSSYVAFDENITINNGDLVQLYSLAIRSGNPDQSRTRNFRLRFTKQLKAIATT